MKSRPNLVVAIIAVVVLILAIIAGVFAANRKTPPLDPTTPDGTVQIFVLAVAKGNDEEAVGLLDPKLGCKAPLENVERPARTSLAVVSSKITDDKATVVLDVTQYGDNMLDSWSHRETYQLHARDNGWMITGEPWPVYVCQ